MTDRFEVGQEGFAPDLNDLFGELFNSSQFENEDALLPERNCSVKEQDGCFRIYDEDEEQFITLPCEGLPGGMLDRMADCQPVMAEESFGRQAQYGWKYRLEDKEGAKWGWIGNFFDQIVPPLFRDFTFVPGRAPGTHTMLAWGVEDYCPALILWHCKEEGGDLQDLGEFLRGGAFQGVFDWPEEQDAPGEKTVFQDGASSVFYWAGEGRPGYYWYWDETGSKYSRQFYYEDGVLREKKNGRAVCSVAEKFDARVCAQAVAGVEEHQGLRLLARREREDGTLEKAVYAVERDGAWAAALYVPKPHVPPVLELLTPYSFTGIEDMGDGLLLLDRFGKKGVFHWEERRYPVPLWYENVVRSGKDLVVARMGQTGTLAPDGSWLTVLH